MRKSKEDHNEYMRQYLRNRYIERMNLAVQRLGNACAVCGRTDDLEIDHIDPLTKKFDPSHKTQYALDKWLEEVDKCQLLCREHHEIKTAKENSAKTPWNKGKGKHPSHHNAYILKCSCDECLRWKKERNAMRRKGR